jgi:hypothetical protein
VSQELPKLESIELQGYALDVDYYLKKDYNDISVASEELPALIEWVNMLVQIYTEKKLIAKQEIKEVEARAYNRLESDPEFTGKKTDTNLSRQVVLQEDVMKAHRRFAVLTGWCSRLINLQISLQSKLDLVRSTESTRRKVYTDDPPVSPE